MIGSLINSIQPISCVLLSPQTLRLRTYFTCSYPSFQLAVNLDNYITQLVPCSLSILPSYGAGLAVHPYQVIVGVDLGNVSH